MRFTLVVGVALVTWTVARACVASVASAPVELAGDAPRVQVWAKRETGYFKVKDGTRLRYSVLLPAKEGKFPIVLIYSGYDTASIGGAAHLQNNVTFR